MVKFDKNKLKEKIASKIPKKFKPLVDKIKKKPKIAARIAALVVIIFVLISGFSLYEKIEASRNIKVSGVIEGDDVRVSFRVEGQIEKLLVDEGSLLKEGEIIAILNKDELTKDRDEARASLVKAEWQFKLDELDYARAENLFEQGAISEQARDAAKTKADTDKASVDKSRSVLGLAEIKLGWADLASPLDGYVITKSSLQGEVVQVGAPVFTVVDLNNIWVTGYINESDLGKVKLGQKAYIKTDSYPHKKYDGWISFVSQQSEFTPKYIQTTEERVKYVYRIKVRADNSSLDLKPGMPADAYIAIE
ncbi:MAG: efflux RND transporter periplasmic adaptor subunit [Candidatus Omnitrophica bacterium]|nr:efflux RND transporter periplasmic adaptor subunit [Candidatus Omnitrophota bacterium]